jgi:hypothetical protein
VKAPTSARGAAAAASVASLPRATRLTRRDLLAATGAGAVLAPFVPLLCPRDAEASSARAPRRLLFFYTSNGTVRERWVPTMNDEGLVLSEILAPLERHRADLVVFDGLGYHCCDKSKGGHEGGMNAALTGSVPKVIDAAKGKSRATGISIDQAIARRVGRGLKLRSLECGVQVDTYDAAVYALSYTGPLEPLMPENDPYKVFGRVFGNLRLRGGAPDEAALRVTRDRKSLIDLVQADLRTVARALGAEEHHKLAGHLESVREIERTLSSTAGPAASRACAKPEQGARLDWNENDNIPLVAKLHTDILVAALACDLTRVGTLQHGRAGANHRLSWLGEEFMEDPAFIAGKDETRGIHSLAHSESRPESRRRIALCQAWYASQVAELVDRLRQIREGDGTLADRTLVVWMNEMGTGNHLLTNTPWTLVGRLGGTLRTDQLISAPRTPHNGLLLGLAHAMGCTDLQSFGAPAYARPIPVGMFA